MDVDLALPAGLSAQSVPFAGRALPDAWASSSGVSSAESIVTASSAVHAVSIYDAHAHVGAPPLPSVATTSFAHGSAVALSGDAPLFHPNHAVVALYAAQDTQFLRQHAHLQQQQQQQQPHHHLSFQSPPQSPQPPDHVQPAAPLRSHVGGKRRLAFDDLSTTTTTTTAAAEAASPQHSASSSPRAAGVDSFVATPTTPERVARAARFARAQLYGGASSPHANTPAPTLSMLVEQAAAVAAAAATATASSTASGAHLLSLDDAAIASLRAERLAAAATPVHSGGKRKCDTMLYSSATSRGAAASAAAPVAAEPSVSVDATPAALDHAHHNQQQQQQQQQQQHPSQSAHDVLAPRFGAPAETSHTSDVDDMEDDASAVPLSALPQASQQLVLYHDMPLPPDALVVDLSAAASVDHCALAAVPVPPQLDSAAPSGDDDLDDSDSSASGQRGKARKNAHAPAASSSDVPVDSRLALAHMRDELYAEVKILFRETWGIMVRVQSVHPDLASEVRIGSRWWCKWEGACCAVTGRPLFSAIHEA